MSLAEPVAAPSLGQRDRGQKRTNKVLLLGNDDRVTLAVARGLGREGISVHVAWCDPTSPLLKSRYVSRFHSLPAYSFDSLAWLNLLNDLVRQQDFDLVIPCNDFAVVPLQTERESLDPNTNWYLLSNEAFQTAFDKAESGRVAKKLGINVPREYEMSHQQIREASATTEIPAIDGRPLRFPIYLKPHSSITQTDIASKRAARKVESIAELAESFHQDFPRDGFLIQEGFRGVGIGVEVLADEGRVLMQIQHKRLRETIDGGSTYRETIAEIPDLTEATHKLVKSLNYTGVAMFEYRYNLESRDWVFLEINARFWGSLPLAVAAGANFPFGLYQLLVNGRDEFESNYQVGKRSRNLIADLRAYRKQKASKLNLGRLLLGREHLDFFASDDWRPQIANLAELARMLAGKIF